MKSVVKNSGPKRRRERWLLTLALLLLACSGAPAQPAISREYEIKAVFLFNFAQFVEWPAGMFAEPGSPIVIGVLGDDPFGSLLEETIRGETVNHRPLLVQRYRHVDEIKTCHLLFISASETDRIETELNELKHRSILTVSDTDAFEKNGGMIRFLTEKNKVRLRINPGAAKAAGLAISSKLLRPAEIVTTRKE